MSSPEPRASTSVLDPRRLAALDALAILDTPAEEAFDAIVRLAIQLCGAPIGLVTFVAADRQWIKARVGLPACGTDLNSSICRFVLDERDLLVIPDLTADPRTAQNPVVTDETGLRFYAGAPLRMPGGQVLGSLCVVDTVPRPQGLTLEQADDLRTLGRQVVTLMVARRALDESDEAADQERETQASAVARAALSQAQNVSLRASDLRWRIAQEAGGIGTFELNVASGMLQVSAELCRLYGVPVAPLYSAATFEALVHPDDARIRSGGDTRADGSAALDVEYRIHRVNDGALRWIARRAIFVRDEAGQAVGMVGTVRDITERRLAEEALRKSEALARENVQRVQLALAAGAIIGTWIWDLPRDRFTVDEAFARAFGLDPALGREGLSLEQVIATVHPDDRRGLIEAIDGVIASGGAYAHQYRVRRADGIYYWIEANGRVDRAPDGRPLSFPGVLIDVEARRAVEAERERAVAALRELNADLERKVTERALARGRTWQVSPDLLVVINEAGFFEAFNPAWTATLGWTEEELAHSPFATFVHPDDQSATQAVWADAVERGLPALRFENRYGHKDGGWRWLSWVGVPDDGKVYCSARDITADKAQAEALLQAEEALRQAQKMEAVGQLTGGVAHDFNNLLAGISGSLEMMSTRISQGRLKDIDKYMIAAQGAAKRAAALTHRLLAFSRQQTLAPRATNVNNLVNGMLDLIQRTVGPGVNVEMVGAAGLWPALVDPSQLENALLNLCINARDAMPGGGRVTIETGNRWIDRQGAKQHDMPEGQYMSLCVSDTGVGMPPDVIARAFDPFFTTKPIGQGTGLGLSMIYGFARQSGGQARIYSELGEGTMVCIYLPRHRGEVETDEALPETARIPFAEAGETVLIVDDEPTVRMLVTDVLEDLGYTAIEASDSAGGLRVLQSDARIDLLVTDVGLPGGMNGRQMADAARAGRPELKVLFITGFAENALLNNGQLEPGMSVLTKPFAMDTLAARLRELITK